MKFDFSALSKNGMLVTFIKVDGTKRVMKCTTNLEQVPIDKHPKGTGQSSTDKLKKVFDLEKNEWRSFLVESVISAEPL